MNDSALYAQALPPGLVDPDAPLALLGGMTPAAFMRDIWHRKPLLIRQAVPEIVPPVSREALFELADRDEVESRLVTHFRNRWKLEHGPFAAENLPSIKTRQWTLLVQGVNLHNAAGADLMGLLRGLARAVGGLLAGVFGLLKGILTGLGSLLRRLF